MKSLIKLSVVFPAILILASCNHVKVKYDDGDTVAASDTVVVADYATDTHIDSGTKAFLRVLNSGGTPLEQLSKEDARNVLVGAQASVKVDLSGITELEKTIKQDGLNVKLNIVRPEGKNGRLPVFIFVHGGGWVLGDYPTHKRLVRDLVVRSGAVAVFVNYTPSPEARYPVALNEIYAATKWVAAHGDEIGVDGKNLAIVGNSVGGNMSTVTTIMAKDKQGPAIKLQLLLWPIVDSGFNTTSYKKYGEDRFLTTNVMKWMFDQYTTDPKQRKEIYASPLGATSDQLKGLPPAVILVAENDILRDEAEAYGRKLDAAGNSVSTVRFNGAIHDFGLLNALSANPSTQSMLDLAGATLKKHLKN